MPYRLTQETKSVIVEVIKHEVAYVVKCNQKHRGNDNGAFHYLLSYGNC